MINLKTKLTAIALSAVVPVNHALAMSLLPDDGGGRGASPAPEIDGPGGIAAIAVVVSIALVIYNRFKTR